MDFVECPAGSFTMGNVDDPKSHYRKHKVTITRPFWMATTKLTIEQWKAYRKNYKPPKEVLELGGGRCPISRMGWKDGNVESADFEEFCEYLTKKYRNRIPKNYVFRSPTEAEWEYAHISITKRGFRNCLVYVRMDAWDNTLDTIDKKLCNSDWTFGKGQTALQYEAEETDPLHIAPEDAGGIANIGRCGDLDKEQKRMYGGAYRLCIGPDPKLLNVYPKK